MGNSVIDLIIRIKNGYMSKKEKIFSPHSSIREEILKKMIKLKFIKDYKKEGEKVKKIIIDLRYEGVVPAVTDVKIYSRPGRRHYVSYRDLKPVLNGYGYSFLTTSKGILTDKEAKKEKLGGELLFSIW